METKLKISKCLQPKCNSHLIDNARLNFLFIPEVLPPSLSPSPSLCLSLTVCAMSRSLYTSWLLLGRSSGVPRTGYISTTTQTTMCVTETETETETQTASTMQCLRVEFLCDYRCTMRLESLDQNCPWLGEIF